MVEMTHTPSTTSLGLAYNAFLFASIGDDAGGTPLSTVSALARLDIDPWREAAELDALPTHTAIRRLADLLARLPDRSDGLLDPEAAAMRLIALLPKRKLAAGGSLARTGAGVASDPTFVVVGFVIALVVLITGLVAALGEPQPAPGGAKPAAVTSAPASDATGAKSALG